MTKLTFPFGNRTILSQDPSALTNPEAKAMYLPILCQVLSAIEMSTGYTWRVTSYVRQSPSHQHGISLDIAPEMAAELEEKYAVTHHSDPVLYKRAPLIRALQDVASNFVPDGYDIGLFIEPDHIHVQLFTPANLASPKIRVVKWKMEKGCYNDSKERMDLPMTDSATGYLDQ